MSFAVLLRGMLVARGRLPRSLGFEAELRLWDGMIVAVIGGRIAGLEIIVECHFESHLCGPSQW